eukprot:COSAG01_NODE_27172_length_692_cov_1.448567_1_plen_75_part_00
MVLTFTTCISLYIRIRSRKLYGHRTCQKLYNNFNFLEVDLTFRMPSLATVDALALLCKLGQFALAAAGPLTTAP